MATAATNARGIRIVTLHPTLNWPRVWRNIRINVAWITDTVRSAWYMVIHDTIPTNERLYRIALTDTNRCSYCDQTDTLTHRITECNVGKDMWNWTRGRLAMILRTKLHHIPDDWPLRPHFHTWPPQRHGAVLRILAHLVYFRTQQRLQPTLQVYVDFMRRAR